MDETNIPKQATNSLTSSTSAPANAADGRVDDGPSPQTSFTIRIRERNRPVRESVEVTGNGGAVALSKVLERELEPGLLPEPILTWKDGDELLAVDLDRPDDVAPATDSEARDLLNCTSPRAAASWVTRNGGVRLMFVKVADVGARALAEAWYLLNDLRRFECFKVEFKCDTRHPKAGRADGHPVEPNRAEPTLSLPSARATAEAAPSEDEIREWLVQNGLEMGRHDVEACPRCADAPFSGNPPVEIDERGLTCYRCKRTWRWPELLGYAEPPQVLEAAIHLVHWGHQELVVRNMKPRLPPKAGTRGYEFILRKVHQSKLTAGDPKSQQQWAKRIERACSSTLDIVRSADGAWLDRASLKPRAVSPSRTLAALPWALNAPMVDAAAGTQRLQGFTPIDPIPHRLLRAPHLPEVPHIAIRMPPAKGEPGPLDVTVGRPEPAALEEAWSELQHALPGINRGYLCSLWVCILAAQRSVGTPPILVVLGVTGSAKNATVYIAASMAGSEVATVTLDDNQDVRRQVGLALEGRKSPLLVDEVGRLPGLYRRLGEVLALNSTVRYAAKYRNECEAHVTSPIVLAGSSMPAAVLRSAELRRRSIGFRLLDTVGRWDTHGDLARAFENLTIATAAAVCLRDVWWDLYDLGENPDWRTLCREKYGASDIFDLDVAESVEGREEAVRQLYECYRTADASELTTGAGWKGWLDARPETAGGQVLAELVDMTADRQAQFGEMVELERLDLARILGFNEPRLILSVKYRGGKYLVKFFEAKQMRGRGTPREELPPAVTAQADDGEAPTTSEDGSEVLV